MAAAVSYIKQKCPAERIAVDGASLGGAAALLADPPLEVDAMILEMVYPNIEDAISNRLKLRFGPLATWTTPLLSWQIKPRLGISADALRPEISVRNVYVPKLFLVGGADRHTTLAESERLFAAAPEPKKLVVFEGAEHFDLLPYNRELFTNSVLPFITRHVSKR